ncbi:MAG: hypothetical protein EXS51_01860 [Candidatus Taylorbacteria bacterium]|nr:hypothetical protein [Candidatus Taylorbacteria bacterium]
MRSEISLARKLRNLREAGATHIEFHNTEAPAKDALAIMKVVRNEGMKVGMATANAFRLPEYIGGNFGHPNPKVREQAIAAAKEYIAVAIEVFDADVYVYWNGSSGFNLLLGKPYKETYLWIAECITEVVRWMLTTYGHERAIPFCIEAKFNEPPSYGIPADAAEALAIINLLPEDVRPFVGTNTETCHSKIGMKRFAVEVALSAAFGKNFHIHLNDGTGAKFDEDRPFGLDWPTAVETVATLVDIDYQYLVGIDVQPFPADTDEQQAASVKTSIDEFKKAQQAAALIDRAKLAELQFSNNDTEILRLFNNALRMGN